MKASINILSLFPETVKSVLNASILRRAQSKDILNLGAGDLRDFSLDKRRSVDDTPYGGKQGMLLSYPVLERACQNELAEVGGDRERLKILIPSPRGLGLKQNVFEQIADWLMSPKETERPRRIALICGRYEGFDERFIEKWVDLEFSMGDFILSGGELPALTLVDGIVRLLPGVLGDAESPVDESFSTGLLEYPQYTKPRVAGGLSVPEELLSGNHKEIDDWNLRESLLLTMAFRPDLIRSHTGTRLPMWARELLGKLKMRLDHKTV